MLTPIESIILYFSVYLIASAMVYVYQRNNNRFFLLMALVLPSILAGIRYMVGTDYYSYEHSFELISNYKFTELLQLSGEFEIGFIFLSKLILMISANNIKLVFGVFAFLTLYFQIKGYENLVGKKNMAIYFAIYLLSSFSVSLNIMRQGLAISLGFYFLRYLFEEKYSKFIIGVLIASTIHISSAILFLLLIVKYKSIIKILKKSPIKFAAIMVIIVSVTPLLPYFLNISISIEKFYDYIAFSETGGLLNAGVDFFIIMIMVTQFLKIRKNKLINFLYGIVPLYLMLNMGGFISVFISRLKLTLEWLPKVFISNSDFLYKEKRTYKVIIISIYMLIFIVNFYFAKQSNIIPFRWK